MVDPNAPHLFCSQHDRGADRISSVPEVQVHEFNWKIRYLGRPWKKKVVASSWQAWKKTSKQKNKQADKQSSKHRPISTNIRSTCKHRQAQVCIGKQTNNNEYAQVCIGNKQ